MCHTKAQSKRFEKPVKFSPANRIPTVSDCANDDAILAMLHLENNAIDSVKKSVYKGNSHRKIDVVELFDNVSPDYYQSRLTSVYGDTVRLSNSK